MPRTQILPDRSDNYRPSTTDQQNHQLFSTRDFQDFGVSAQHAEDRQANRTTANGLADDHQCPAQRCPTSSTPTTVTAGASMTISRHDAIDTPDAAKATAAVNTAAVAIATNAWNECQARARIEYSTLTAVM